MTPAEPFPDRPKLYPDTVPPTATVAVERRSKVRFPLDLLVSYRTLGRASVSGEGRAVNLSSSGMLVSRPHQLSVGDSLELRVEWPSLLEGRIGLQLVVTGKVVRSGPSSFAVFFNQHQFRTTRTKSGRMAAH